MAEKTEESEQPTASQVVGLQVKEAREMMRLTQATLAKQLRDRGVPMHQVTVARLEGGNRSVSVDDVFAIAATLGVSPLHLLSGGYTGDRMPVLPNLTPGPQQMNYWLRGELALPGTDVDSFAEVVPDRERHARLRRGVDHMRQCLRDYNDAVLAKEYPAMLDALDDLRRELDRQEADLEREQRLAEKENRNG